MEREEDDRIDWMPPDLMLDEPDADTLTDDDDAEYPEAADDFEE